MGAKNMQLWLRKNEGSKRAAMFDPNDTLCDVYTTILNKEHYYEAERRMLSRDEMNKIALAIKDQTFSTKTDLSKTLKECGVEAMDEITYTLKEPLLVPMVGDRPVQL